MEKNNKIVNILTFHRAINYGAVWQCYALVNFLQQKGYSVSVIDFFPTFFQQQYYKLPKKPRNFFIKLFMIPKLKKFVQRNLPLTEKFSTKQDLLNYSWAPSNFICGSDQIWNYDIVKDDLSAYLLDFAPTTSDRISYSASIGGKGISENKKPIFCEELRKYKVVSVREKIAKTEIEKIVNTSVEVLLDPVFLLDKELYLKKISNRFKNKKYILVIDLEKSQKLQETALNIQKQTNLPIINISGLYLKYAKNPLGISPQDWLSAIHNAEYVCVNSFHGLSFSIIFEKKFFYVERIPNDKNNRAVDLLNILELSERFITNTEKIDINKGINYSNVNDALFQYREKSRNFLINNCK